MIVVSVASIDDAQEISELLEQNSIPRGGALFGDWSVAVVGSWIADKMPVFVARTEGRLAGVLMSSEKGHASSPPVVGMLQAWSGGNDCYVYGPVCVAQSERGGRVLQALYDAARQHYNGRDAILFISTTNKVSIKAHARLGMRNVARFRFDDTEFEVFTDARFSQPDRRRTF